MTATERRLSPPDAPPARDREPRVLALVLETEAPGAQALERILLEEGYESVWTVDEQSLLRELRLIPPDVVIVGSVAGRPSAGPAVVRAVRTVNPWVPVILVVDRSSEALAVAALRAGASDYVRRSGIPGVLRASLARVSRAGSEPVRVAAQGSEGRIAGDRRLLGDSAPMQSLRRRIARVARSDSNLLLTGETGTGKELVAELVHRNSRRSKRPFVPINCAAIPESLLESELFGHERGAFTGADRRREGMLKAAAGGTVLLDEIGDLQAYAQAKLLRAIERKEVQRLGSGRSIPVDVRIIAATNRDIERLVADGGFRRDLYFRLDVARIDIPPLRDRREDLHPLCEHLLGQLNRRFEAAVEGFTLEAFNCLFWHSWPGNVRELQNVLEATFVDNPRRRIGVEDLPEAFLRRFRDADNVPERERDRVLWALYSSGWNKSKAARRLHWSRMTLYRKMDRYHLVQAPVHRPPSGTLRT